MLVPVTKYDIICFHAPSAVSFNLCNALILKGKINTSIEMTALKLVLIFVLTNCFVTDITAQSLQNGKTIPGDTLKWEYFTGKPDSNSNYWAETNWNVYYKYKIRSFHMDTVTVDLNIWHVLKENSWVLEDKETEQLLHHEQGHFNLAIACEAEFKKAVDTTILRIYNYKQKIDSVFNTVLKNITQLNAQYDKETNHMYNIEQQKQWDEKIHMLIRDAE